MKKFIATVSAAIFVFSFLIVPVAQADTTTTDYIIITDEVGGV